MPIDVAEKALAADLEPIEFSWTSSDIQLYHLGLGAGADPMDERELRYFCDRQHPAGAAPRSAMSRSVST